MLTRLVLFLFLSSPLLVLAQTSITPYAGLNLMPYPSDELEGRPFAMGLGLGADIGWSLSERISVVGGLRYFHSRQSYQRIETSDLLDDPTLSLLLGDLLDDIIEGLPEGTADLVNTDSREITNGSVTLQYVQIPIRAQFHFSRLHLGFGPTVNILFGVEDRTQLTRDIPLLDIVDIDRALGDLGGFLGGSIQTSGTDEVESSNSTEGFAPFNIGLAFEASYFFDNNMVLSLSYLQGLLDYRENPLPDDKLSSNVLLTVGYRFSLAGMRSEEKPYGGDGIN